jgi:hypothetical protein
MRGRLATVVAVAATALPAVGVADAAEPPSGPYPLPGGVLVDHTCKEKWSLPELRCFIRWYRPSAIPRGDNMVTRMHFRFVFTLAKPPTASQREVYVRGMRAWMASKTTEHVRVVQPLRLRWANGSRVLVADFILEDT